MTQLLISLIALTAVTVSFAGEDDLYSVSDYKKKTIQTLKELNGNYINSRSDRVEVVYAVEEDDSPQPDLFPSNKFRFYISDQSSHAGVQFSLEDMESSKNGEVIFEVSNSDCNYPGCSMYDAVITFKKNRKGVYYATLEAEVRVDAEDISGVYEELREEGASREEISKQLHQECKDSYGPTASLGDISDDYKNSIYCDYEIKMILKKSKK